MAKSVTKADLVALAAKAVVVQPAPVILPDLSQATQQPSLPGIPEVRKSKSVVPPKYKAKYATTGTNSCNDDIAHQLKVHVTKVTIDGPSVDLPKLQRFAKANNCWSDTYARLNPGMQRMNVGNRLRALVRQPGFTIVWTE